MATTILLAAFAAVFLVQLWARWRENHRLNLATKPLLVPLIMAWYCVAVPFGHYNWLVLAGLALGWLGDVLRIFDATRRFGFFPFVAGHFVYIAAYLLDAPTATAFLPWLWIPTVPAILYTLFYNKKLLPKGVTPSRKRYMLFYVFVVTMMAAFSAVRLIWAPRAGAGWVTLGAVLFWLSDQILIWGTGGDSGKNRIPHVHVYVMLSYTLGQFFIAFGYAALALSPA